MACTAEVRMSKAALSISRELSLELPRGEIFEWAPSEAGGRAFESRPGHQHNISTHLRKSVKRRGAPHLLKFGIGVTLGTIKPREKSSHTSPTRRAGGSKSPPNQRA